MTVAESLQALNTYPVDDNAIEKFCIDRVLVSTEVYTITIGASQAYELATADVYFWLSTHPSIVEQEVGMNQAIAIKENLLSFAMQIYGKYDDPKFTGIDYGLVGEDYNV